VKRAAANAVVDRLLARASRPAVRGWGQPAIAEVEVAPTPSRQLEPLDEDAALRPRGATRESSPAQADAADGAGPRRSRPPEQRPAEAPRSDTRAGFRPPVRKRARAAQLPPAPVTALGRSPAPPVQVRAERAPEAQRAARDVQRPAPASSPTAGVEPAAEPRPLGGEGSVSFAAEATAGDPRPRPAPTPPAALATSTAPPSGDSPALASSPPPASSPPLARGPAPAAGPPPAALADSGPQQVDGSEDPPAHSAPPPVLIDQIQVVTPPAEAPPADPLASLAGRRTGRSRHSELIR
jgi:hypothetical protein